MLKKIREKRVEAFKKAFPNYQTSKKGNLYYRYQPGKETLNLFYSGYSMTKGTYSKVGTSETRRIQNEKAVFLITSDTGKLMVKRNDNNKKRKYYKQMTLKDILALDCERLNECFFIGRKYEYLKDHRNLWLYRIFQNFTSLKEAKKFLGFGFINNTEFLKLFRANGYNIDYILMMGITEHKPNIVSLLNESENHQRLFRLFQDYVNMCNEVNLKPNIPSTIKRLNENHNELSKSLAQRKAANACDKVIFESRYVEPEEGKSYYLDAWKDMGLKFRQLVTKKQMFYQGMKQKHCIGSAHSNLMDSYSYYTITYKNYQYDIQVRPNGTIGHFYGACNTSPPTELCDLIHDKRISYRHKIIRIREDSEPIKHEPKHGDEVVAANAEDYDDLPFF